MTISLRYIVIPYLDPCPTGLENFNAPLIFGKVLRTFEGQKMQAFFMIKKRGSYKSAEDKRTEKIEIRTTKKEKSAIEKKAEKAGLSVSDFARQNLINDIVFSKGEQPQAGAEPTEKNTIDRRTIVGLATNLNQLTKHVNSTHEIHPELMECLRLINNLMSK